jgi:hypothetical protein
MRKRGFRVGLPVLLGVLLPGLCVISSVAGASPSPGFPGFAAGFSSPVRLSETPHDWQFAVNDRGEAVGVYGAEAGATVVRLGRSGRVVGSWLVRAPAHVGSVGAQVSVGERGQVVVGLSYGDGLLEASHEEHGGPGCCEHLAVASWRLGQSPPVVAQPVSPVLGVPADVDDQPSQLQLAIGAGSTVTAVWMRGSAGPGPYGGEGGEAQVEEAYGRVGGPLRTVRLLTVAHRVSFLDLHVAPNGRAVASWVDDGDVIRTVTGMSSGALRAPGRFQRVSHLVTGVGFLYDDRGDTVFSYVTGSWLEGGKLMMVAGTSAGARFAAPRRIASIPPEAGEIVLSAGGDRSVMALWTIPRGVTSKRGLIQRLYARRMIVFGGLGPLLQVDQTSFYEDATGFIDSQRRSVVIHRGPDTSHPGQFEQQASIADPNGPFKGPYRLAPGLPGCSLDTGEEREIQPIATSPNAAQAVLYLTCNEPGEREGPQYLIRYGA